MPDSILEIGGRRILVCATEGPILHGERDAGAFMAHAWAQRADMLAIPTTRIDETFFRLRTGIAGEIVQKFVNYRLQLVILGDVSHWTGRSEPFRDYVYESNRGTALWFVAGEAELRERISKS